MRPEERSLARQQLDKRLTPLRQSQDLARPPRGWIRAIRDALGMTTKQLGLRMGVSQPRVTHIEKAENDSSITLDTLQRAANAMDCQLVYALIPRRPLQDMIKERATQRARTIMHATAHSMTLEDQRADHDTEQAQLQQLIKELMDNAGSSLWREE